MPLNCAESCGRRAAMKRPKTGEALCQECFFQVFEQEVHQTIVEHNLFKPGDYVAIGASGGKDSTVLAYMMKLLNDRHNYGLKLVLLSVDEGITGYRDDSLETVKRNEKQYDIPLQIYSYKDLYGWTMDEIVREIGRKNNCTFCGVFRRQALDRGAVILGVNKIVTGHNADDVAETILMNLLRGDVARLQRCTSITTGADGALPRCKPLKYTYEKEIVMYAYYKKLDYFSTECIYSPNAYRGHVRALIKDLERIQPSSIIDIIHSGEALSIKEGVKMPVQGVCERCNYISSQSLCKACVMLEGLNKGLPKLGIGKSSKVKGQLESLNNNSGSCGSVESSSIQGAVNKSSGGCCSGMRGHKECQSQYQDNPDNVNSEGNCCKKQKGRRSSNKQKKAQERNAKTKLPTPPTDLSEVFSPRDGQDQDDDADEYHQLEFFGCGGFSEPIRTPGDEAETVEDDDVGTMASKMLGDTFDIENLASLASTMLHMNRNNTSSVKP